MMNILEKTVILADATYYNLRQGIEKMQSLMNFFAKRQNKIQDQMEDNAQSEKMYKPFSIDD